MSNDFPPRYINEKTNPAYVDQLEKKLKHIKNAFLVLDSFLELDTKEKDVDLLPLYGAALTGIKRILKDVPL